MPPRGNARVSIIGDATSLKRASAEGERALSGLAEKGSRHFSKLAKQAGAAAVAYVGIAEAKSAITTTEDLAKATLGLHNALGLSIEESSRWAAVARARGIETKQLQQTFGTLSKNVEAGAKGWADLDAKSSKLGVTQRDQIKRQELLSKGAGAQAEAFKRLGITQADLQRGDFDAILAKAADGLGRMHGGTERATIAMKLFGRGWQTIVPLMNDGSKGMREQLALADKYGVTFQGKTVKSVKELIAAQREAKFATMGFQLALGQQLIPTLTKVIGGANKFVAGMRDGTGAGGHFAKTAKEIADELRPTVKWLGNAASSVAEFASEHRSVTKVAAAILGVGIALKTLRFGSSITGFSLLLKAARTTAGALVPIFAKKGAEAGAVAGAEAAAGASSGSVLAKMRAAGALGGGAFGKAFKLAAGVGIASAIAQALNVENADPLLFLHPPAAGDPKNKQKLQQLIDSGAAQPSATGLLRLPRLTPKSGLIDNPMRLPKLTQGPTAATGGKGKIIGTPGVGTHTLGNWQSDNAVDISIKVGTPILAVESGTIAKVTIHDNGGGRFAGSQLTLNGESGNSYFYAHLSSVSVKAGQKVAAGQTVGRSGSANGVPHLHFATETGDPRTMKLPGGGGFAVNALSTEQRTVNAAAKKYGIDPAILWGVYGQESAFGKNAGLSSAGALGPFQLMPGTARSLGVTDRTDFRQSVYGAARYLSQYKSRGTAGMLAAYNAGPNGNPNNAETQKYIPGVLGFAKQWGTVQDGQLSTNPTSWKNVAEAIAAATIKPIAQRLRAQLGPISGALGRQDAQLGGYGDTLQVIDAQLGSYNMDTPAGRGAAYDSMVEKRNTMLAQGYVRGRKKASLEAAARKYSAAIKRLKAKLKSAPKAQRPTLRAQIKRYQDRIKALNAEARGIGVQLQIDAADMTEISGQITEISTPARPDFVGGMEKAYGAADVAASLTPGTADDLAQAQKYVTFYEANYNHAVKVGDIDGQIEWGGKLKGARDTVTGLTADQPTEETWASADIVKASFTPDKGDDVAGFTRLRNFYKGKYDAAVASNDPLGIIEWGGKLKDAQDSIDQLTGAVKDNTAVLQEQNDLLKQQVDLANRRANVSQAETETLGRSFLDWMSGELGGRIGPGFMTPSAPGVGATY